jgi:hypothetical protein
MPRLGLPPALPLRIGLMAGFASINFSQKMTIELCILCLNIRAKSELGKEIGKNAFNIK